MNYTFSDKIAALKPSAIREILKAPKDADTITLAAGNPAPETFPVEELARLSADIFASQSTLALQYGATDGYEPLREAVAKRQKTFFGLSVNTKPIGLKDHRLRLAVNRHKINVVHVFRRTSNANCLRQ